MQLRVLVVLVSKVRCVVVGINCTSKGLDQEEIKFVCTTTRLQLVPLKGKHIFSLFIYLLSISNLFDKFFYVRHFYLYCLIGALLVNLRLN